jgi:hypothetical protein
MTQLRYLDISHNPGITGDLPNSWFTLRALTTLDISHTGIGGTLPEDYAAFQELREFKAVNCPNIYGQLPPAWGLLKLEVLEITNSGISGVLPREWADAMALRQAAVSLSASQEAKSVVTPVAMTAAALESGVAAVGSDAASAQPAALAMQRLRVLDLSVVGPGKGGLTGALPETFAALEQLQVSFVLGADPCVGQYMLLGICKIVLHLMNEDGGHEACNTQLQVVRALCCGCLDAPRGSNVHMCHCPNAHLL